MQTSDDANALADGASSPGTSETSGTSGSAGSLTKKLLAYHKSNSLRGAFELAITATPFALAWVIMAVALTLGYFWLYALFIVPAAGFVVRLFLIQHDCGHGAFFPNKKINDWIGRIISVITVTPYDMWRRAHALHHATNGNLDRRGYGDIDTLTVAEYMARSRWGRLRYRLYRHPIVMFGIGPVFVFFVQNRLPTGLMSKGWRPWASTMSTNLAIAVTAGLAVWAVGLWTFLLIQVPIMFLGSAFGVWLFYVQHQFEQTHWAKGENWNMEEAALAGSSHYVLPNILRWFTANIGVHHVHHLSSRIPYYRLPQVLRDHPEFSDVSRLTFLQSLKSVKLVLWDEARQRLVSFKEMRAAYGA